MRLDQYMKTTDNDINLAEILYSFGLITLCGGILVWLLNCSLSRDFTKLTLLDAKRRARRQRLREEDEVGLTD